MRVAVLGLGEAGGRYAADLVRAGCEVSGYDPAPVAIAEGVRRAASAAAAVRDAELVLSLTGAAASVPVAAEAATALAAGSCLADLNTSAPAVKRQVQQALSGVDVALADVAVLAPVPRLGLATPLLAAGPGAERAAALLGAVGAPVTVLAAPVGAAAARKLLRSVFMKGFAACVLEALAAGAAAGCEDWVRDQLTGELGEAMVDRLVTGSREHAGRRVPEMAAARDYLAELGVPADVCEASIAWLGRSAGGGR
jgi:3-hydroxyisobutyrate dehydrogenase-like beta-hydroxyacid dehydrogenase